MRVPSFLQAGPVRAYALCDRPGTPAPVFGVTSAVLLLLAQIIVHASAGCCTCCTNMAGASGRARTAAILAPVFSWIAFVSAQFLLLVAAALNTQSILQGLETCSAGIGGWSAGGGALALTSVILGIGFFYLVVTLERAAMTSASQQDHGIAMAQTLFPPHPASSPTPAVIQENHYKMRQIP